VITKVLGVLSLVLMLVTLYLIFAYAPTEATMGVTQKIFYFHLPQAIASYVSALLLGFACIMYLWKSDLKWDRFGSSVAELGLMFTVTTIVSGMIWAKPAWGIYWTWDARLTLQFVLGLLFVAYFMLRAYLPNREKRATLSCVFGLLAMIDVPFNYGAIYWWRTQHPQPVVSPGGGGIDPQMRVALLVSFAAWAVLYAYLLRQRTALAKTEEQVEYLEHVVQSV
jgi:heme exporter protein C